MIESETAKNFSELERLYPLRRRMRSFLRDAVVFLLSSFPRTDSSKEWIRFPFYHHVFDDERKDFQRHLRYFRNQGDFISIDDAVDIFEKKQKIGGHYFCVTFDDGFKNCLWNALPILAENNCPAAFFIPTDYIGWEVHKDKEIIRRFFIDSRDAYPLPIDFLNWRDCRTLIAAGMTIGSHACRHLPPVRLDKEQLKTELVKSKKKIEEELGVDCNHFCCPWGLPVRDFKIGVDPLIAKEAGYRSFFTIMRGPSLSGTDPFCIRRDHLLAKWQDYQLRYFFTRG